MLFAADLTPDSLAAAPYAVSFAEENQAELILFHVIHDSEKRTEMSQDAVEVANALYELDELVPAEAELWCRPEKVVEYGIAAERILEVARRRAVDLIVLGVHDTGKGLGAAIHLERTTAHKVVAHATCRSSRCAVNAVDLARCARRCRLAFKGRGFQPRINRRDVPPAFRGAFPSSLQSSAYESPKTH